jgi:hypothetical protein
MKAEGLQLSNQDYTICIRQVQKQQMCAQIVHILHNGYIILSFNCIKAEGLQLSNQDYTPFAPGKFRNNICVLKLFTVDILGKKSEVSTL